MRHHVWYSSLASQHWEIVLHKGIHEVPNQSDEIKIRLGGYRVSPKRAPAKAFSDYLKREAPSLVPILLPGLSLFNSLRKATCPQNKP